MEQMSMFEFLDETLAIFQNQVGFTVTKYQKNYTWESQNRQEWFLYYTDGSGKENFKSIQTMLDLTIIKGFDWIKIKRVKFVNHIFAKGTLIAYETEPNFYKPVR